MASTIILSDNGVSSGSAGLKSTAGNDGVLILQTTTSGGAATNAVYIDATQQTGFGTASPTARVTLSGTGASVAQDFTNTTASTGRRYRIVSGDNGNAYITDMTGSADVLSIGSSGNTIALQGGSISAGAGITFPATQSASSDANTLDDYEEGTWTPTDGSGAGLSFTNTSGNCVYTKVGRVVTACFRVTYPSTANSSFAYIGGLPFAGASTTVNVQGAYFVENSYVAGATATIDVGTTRALILSTSGGSVLIATNANLSGKDLRGMFTYQV